MLTSLIQTAGLWFLIACTLELAAVFSEQAGSARSQEEEQEKRNGFVALLALTASLLTPGLLLAHAFLSTQADQSLRVLAIGAPIAAMLGGALLGAMFGAVARGAGGVLRLAALPLALAALGVTLYATLPSIRLLIEAAQNNWTLPAP